MKLIHKATFPLAERISIALPQGIKILSFQEQRKWPTIWYYFNEENRDRTAEIYEFRIIGTGNPFDDTNLEFIQTCQFSDGFVWHLFQEKIQ